MDCEPTKSVLVSLKDSNWIFTRLVFCGCSLEKLAPDNMFYTFFFYLQSLKLNSDRISNKGLKRLGLFDLTNLRKLAIGNTAITADVLKLISKIGSKLLGIGFFEQKHFSYDLLFAKVVDLNLQQTTSSGLTFRGSFDLDSFVYLGRLSKAHIY